MIKLSWTSVVMVILSLCVSGCGGSGGGESGQNTVPFTYAIDPSVAPAVDVLDDPVKGPRPVAAVEDANGVVTSFIENEILISPQSDSDLNDFLARYGGEILSSDEVPDPPPALQKALTAEEKKATSYLVRLDPSALPLDQFISDAEKAGFGGDRKISSDRAARLYALIMNERKGGREARPNYLFLPQTAIVNHTQEAIDPNTASTPIDAFKWFGLPYSPTKDGNKSDVLGAWSFVLAHGITRRVNVAIIDGGFWLDANGNPMIAGSGIVSDLPHDIYQYDFVADDYTAGGENPVKCTGGSSCLWHGNGTAGVAVGIPDNHYGTAGTGGWVADPFLFKTDFTSSTDARAVRTARDWGADVVSMSFSGSCDIDCNSMLSGVFTDFQDVMAAKVILVAGAGNNGNNIDSDPQFPCGVVGLGAASPGVLCVGALDDGSTSRISYSNYGHDVDIFAPTDIVVMPDGATNGSLKIATGTSASTPFIAGIVAMMKAIKPDATNKEIQDALLDTAGTASGDSTVPRFVNALAAVEAIAGNALPPDALEPNDTLSQAPLVSYGAVYDPLTISNDYDYFKLTVNDYSSIDLNLDYFAFLDKPKLFWTGGVFPAVETATDTTDGRTVHEDLLPPGQYYFGLTGGYNLYHLQVLQSPASLQPDAFEVNDTFGTAAAPPTGSYLATRHTTTDDDYYVYNAFGLDPPGKIFAFTVPSSDRPVILSYYKNGTLVTTFPSSTAPSVTLSEDATYTFKITGTQTTRYTFRAGASIDPNAFQFAVPVDWIPVIDPTGGTDHIIIGPEDVFAFQPVTAVLGRFGGIQLTGDGLKLSLLDTQGNVVSEGVDGDFRAGSGQELSFTGVTAGGTYLLVVARKDEAVVPDAALPILSYNLDFQSLAKPASREK